MTTPINYSIRTYRGGYDANLTYLVAPFEGGTGFIIDAACDAETLLADAQRDGVTIGHLLVTHSHYDHLVDARKILDATGATVIAHQQSIEGLETDIWSVRGGEILSLGPIQVEVFHTPGHAPDHLSFAVGSMLFTGDALFIGRTGRTISPGSDAATLYRSLQQFDRLAEETRIFPGHDYGPQPSDTLGRQRKNNPFLRARSEEEFLRVMEEYEASRS